MLKGNIDTFFESLCNSEEVWISYNGRKYFIQGFWLDNERLQHLEVQDLDLWKIIWESNAEDQETNVDKFRKANIFNNKSFDEIQAEVEWLDE